MSRMGLLGQPSRAFLLSCSIALLPRLAFSETGWFKQVSGTTETLNAVAFADANSGVVVGRNGTILQTRNGGDDWTLRDSGVRNHLWAVSFVDRNTVVAVGGGRTVLRSEDAGRSWTTLMGGGLATFFGLHMVDSEVGYAVGVNAIFEPAFLKTTDGGATWKFSSFYITEEMEVVKDPPVLGHFIEASLMDVHFLDRRNGFALGYLSDKRGLLLRTSDGGGNWEIAHEEFSAFMSIDFPSKDVGVIVGTEGIVLRSEDGGKTWERQFAHTPQILFSVDFQRPQAGTAVGRFGVVRRTADGEHWTIQDSGTREHLYGTAFVDAFTGTIVGEHGVILRTLTGGRSIGRSLGLLPADLKGTRKPGFWDGRGDGIPGRMR